MSAVPGLLRVLRGRRVATADGVRPAAVHVAADGRIAAIREFSDVPPGDPPVEADDRLVFPGLVDTHVHINDPGRSDWEGFDSATRAAAAGGVTTLLDMPLNSVPATTSVAALERKRAAARGRCAVDVGFLGGLVPGGGDDLEPLHMAGVFGFKCFLAPTGVEEFAHVEPGVLRGGLARLAALGSVLMVHAELPAEFCPASGDPRRYATWLATRPALAETAAVSAVIEAARATAGRVHVVHVSAAQSVALLAEARRQGVWISAETCPHYLAFTARDIPDGATEFKCAPPLRGAPDREALWAGLVSGTLELVVSDHSPAPPEHKAVETGDFLAAWGGIASLQLRLPAVWTEARARGIPAERLVDWLCGGPARLVGLGGRKGALLPGADADLVVWDDTAEFEVDPASLLHRHSLTPWAGRRLAGVVEATYLRGVPVFIRGMPPSEPRGRLLSRHET